MNTVPRIRVLADNVVGKHTMLAEHGFAALLEHAGVRILFDTGQGNALAHNARVMGISMDSLDAIVLSHGHYDHTGGLAEVLPVALKAKVFLHPKAVEQKFAKSPRPPHRSIGFPQASLQALEASMGRVVWSEGPTEVVPGVWCTGEIPRPDGRDASEGRFFADAACTQPDQIPDDQAIFMETPKGLWVLTGCAHAGVVNTLDYVLQLTGRKPLIAVVGGFHMIGSSREQWREVLAALQERGVQHMGPCHCTGMGALAYLREWCPEKFWEVGTGWVSPARV